MKTTLPTPRQFVRVLFDDGNSLQTWINGTREDATKYYLGNSFNVGSGPDDKIAKVVSVEFLT